MKPIAFVFDYDLTLTQGYGINALFAKRGIDPNEFWTRMMETERHYGFNEAFLNHLIFEAEEGGLLEGMTNAEMEAAGADVVFYDGVEDFIPRLKEMGEEYNLDVRVYAVSSGIEEVITGSAVGQYLDGVFGAKLRPDVKDGVIKRIAHTVCPHQKAKMLRAISAGASGHGQINVYKDTLPRMDERPIPKSRMHFIGDGQTDAEAMAELNKYGAHNFAVHGCDKSRKSAYELHWLGHAQELHFADYTAGSDLMNAFEKRVEHFANPRQLSFF
ncbi:TPA: hypothetical protein HA278_00105 [Candidatus Woesearchaeota archaeon]|nr:hypothetical protein [archaeon]HIJ10431.1 hypothetical protein [Candidatus Woesearchaeota archaeon]